MNTEKSLFFIGNYWVDLKRVDCITFENDMLFLYFSGREKPIVLQDVDDDVDEFLVAVNKFSME